MWLYSPQRLSLCRRRALLCVVAIAVSLLQACGFHLRGQAALPDVMDQTYIQGSRTFDSLYDDFREALESHGVSVVSERSEATAVLNIVENETQTSVLTVDIGGKVQELDIRQSIEFEVMSAEGQPLLGRQSVTLNRDFVFNKDDILGKEREWELISAELQRDVVNLSMLRIIAAGR